MKALLAAFWKSPKPGWRIARIVTVFIVLSVVLTMMFEESMIYLPSRYPEGFWDVDRFTVPDGEIGPSIEDVEFEAEDGVRLHGWYVKPIRMVKGMAKPVETRGTVLWFHGNAGNISHRISMLGNWVGVPVDVFIIDYRGYGKSGGSPGEEGLYRDVRAAWKVLTETREIPPERIVIYGKSLGGAPAAQLASEVKSAGLIVESSFTSARAMARHMIPVLPLWLVVRTRFDSASKVREIRTQKLFIHSPADEVIPFRLGKELYEAAAEPKDFWEVPDTLHNEMHLAEGYPERLKEFLLRVLPVR